MGQDFQIISPDFDSHDREIAELAVGVFYEEGTEADIVRHQERLKRKNWIQQADCRIGLADGKIVTNFLVQRYTMRLGSAFLEVAGVGCVATHPAYRKRGLLRRTAMDAIAGFRNAGYDASVLFGIADFYEKFGYVRAWSDETYTLKIQDLETSVPAPVLETISGAGYTPELVECMNRTYKNWSGSAVRPTHGGFFRNDGEDCFNVLWRDAGGQVAGSIFGKHKEGKLEIVDHSGELAELIAAIVSLGDVYACETLVCPRLHHQSELARHLRLGNCVVTTHYRRNAGALVRLVNASSCLRKMIPDLRKRLALTSMADWEGILDLSDGRETVCLEIGNGEIRLVFPRETQDRIEAGDFLASLIFGAENPLDTLARREVECHGAAAELVPILFPETYPQLSSINRF